MSYSGWNAKDKLEAKRCWDSLEKLKLRELVVADLCNEWRNTGNDHAKDLRLKDQLVLVDKVMEILRNACS